MNARFFKEVSRVHARSPIYKKKLLPNKEKVPFSCRVKHPKNATKGRVVVQSKRYPKPTSLLV